VGAALEPGRLFAELRAGCAQDWRGYVEHDFVRRLGAGTLPEAAFRHYLTQDYLFLIHFARAHALAVYKSDTLDDMRDAAAAVSQILNVEMGLHVKYCAGWGLTESDMAAVPEARQTMAYTRYVLERGMAGDLLDLSVALAPCVIGYGEIGDRLMREGAARDGNPYRSWIEAYGGADYKRAVGMAGAQLDRLHVRRGGPARLDRLIETFRAATVLETDFWQMGLDAA
jgi:thiaminase (transcriptional activator TenA)